MRLLVKVILAAIVFFTGILIVLKSLEYYSPDFSSGYLSDKRELFDGIFKYGLYAHISTVPVILLVGSFQVFFRYEQKWKALHKTLGKIYVYLILGVSAPGALIISFYAFGGWTAKTSFLLLTILWGWFTFRGFVSAKRREVPAHKNFMIRSYVLTLSAIFLRMISFIFIHYFQFYGTLAYSLAAWLCWLPFLIITELIIIYKKI